MCIQLTDIAQNYANRMASTNSLLEESRNGKIGESFYKTSGTSLTYTEAVEQAITTWYSESRSYDYNNTRYQPEAAHFTQLVWQETKELGVAVTKSFDSTIVTCCYYSCGNVAGTFPQNVHPPFPQKDYPPYYPPYYPQDTWLNKKQEIANFK